MTNDFLLHLWKASRTTTRKRENTIVLVTMSRAKSQIGFDALWSLDIYSAGWWFGFTASWLLALASKDPLWNNSSVLDTNLGRSNLR